MPVRFSLKSSLLILLGSFLCAAGITFLVNWYLEGPKLGFQYDFLVNLKKSPVVSQEILIIEAPEFIESNDIFLVLLTLTEMDAADLIMTSKVSSASSSITVTEADIRRRFLDEYIIMGTNIRNLFDAIRSGSVSPVYAPGYVDALIELTEQGRDRLLTAIIDKDEDLLRSINLFGNYLEADEKPQLDKDGKLRRVRPVDLETSLEHPVFSTLKHLYAVSQIETVEKSLILWLRGFEGGDLDIHLDLNGNIITPWNCEFRRIDISAFKEYEEAGRRMRSAMEQADKLGAFSPVMPERSPLFLGDYTLILREEMLRSPSAERRIAWTASVDDYFLSLEQFLGGQSESILVRGYDEVIADEITLNETGLAALALMRDELKTAFSLMREEYEKLKEIRLKLKEQLDLSFCVMGPVNNADYSALLANAIITGSHIKPVLSFYVFFISVCCVFLVLMIIFLMRPFIELFAGIALSFLASAAYGFLFVYFSLWLDPLVVLIPSLCGTLFIFFSKFALLKYRSRAFRAAYGTAVSKNILKYIIRLGRPGVTEINVAKSAVIAIKDTELFSREDYEKPQDAGKAKKLFYSTVKEIAFSSGGVVTGYEGDTVLVCFGSPLDKTGNPADKACALVSELLNNNKIAWHFGIDIGECTFSWSPEMGYAVNGRAAVHARVLSSRTSRIKVRSLFTISLLEEAYQTREKISAKKVGTLKDDNESVYTFS
jgi:hypothetical protein